MVKGFKYYREGWPIRSIIIQHLANSKKRWNQDLKIENAELRRPNREAIAAYKESLGAKSGKSKVDDMESSDSEEGPEELEDDEEELDFDVLIEDDTGKDKDGEDLDKEEGAEASGNEDEESEPGENNARVSVSKSLNAPVGISNKKIRGVLLPLLSLLTVYSYFSFYEERPNPGRSQFSSQATQNERS